MFDFIFEDIKPFSLDQDKISNWLENSIEREHKISGEVCFIFCSDSYLLKINQDYLKHNYFTDVITFDYSGAEIISGDVFISIDRISENAKQFRVSFDYELLRVIIHGVLHLIGYKDKTVKNKLEMTSMEDKYLKEYSDVEGV